MAKDSKWKIRSLNKRVLVEEFDHPDKTDSGLYIPDSAKEKAMDGLVVSAANDCEQAKEGDHVIFAKYGGTVVVYNKREYRSIPEEELLGVFEGE